MSARLVVLASGSGSNLQALLHACGLGAMDAQVVAVFVNRKDARAQDRAEASGVPGIHVPLAPFLASEPDAESARRAYDANLARSVAAYEPDAVVLAGWMHLLSMAFLEHFPAKVINLHPALPGTFPGAHAIDDAWAAHESDGLDHTGVMVHLVPNEGVDDGPVLATRRVEISPDDTRETLEERIHAVEHELLVEAVSSFLS
ncbi:MAG: phosphoribosylglycinamide formyltransferase [Acidimicrobiales bacterium]